MRSTFFSAMTACEHPTYSGDVLMAYGATNDPDTLYYHEAMAAPDRDEFIKAMAKELEGQIEMGVFSLRQRTEVPNDASILPAVWAMRRKRKQTDLTLVATK